MKKPTILVAEDEAIVARDICLQLVEFGYEPVARTSSAEHAIELAGTLRPDLVLMDVHLAGTMDGIGAAMAIRERFALPVVFLTAFSGGDTLTRAKLAEPFGYITKPFSERDLHTAIEMALYKHQAETALRNSETKFRTLYDSTGDAVMLLDGQGFFDCNRATLATFGCTSREEFCTRHPADLSPPVQPGGVDSLTLANERIATAMVQGSQRFDWVHRRLDNGSDFHAEVLLSAMQLEGKTVLQAVVRDIGARKQAEADLRLARQLLDSIVENMPAMVFLKRASDLRFELLNRAGETLLGHPRSALIGKTDHDLFPAEQADAFMAEDRRTMAAQGIVEIPLEPIRTASGETRYLHTKKVVLRDALGQPTHLLGISLDVSEQKKAAEELVAAKEESERANRAKSEFLATMSHEIRTPMNAVIGMTSLLLDSPLSARQREFAEVIRHSGENLLVVIDDILDYSKIESGNMTLEWRPVDLDGGVESSIQLLALRANEKQLELKCAIESDVPRSVYGDMPRLRQVLVNLVSNAVKFTQRGHVRVSIRNVTTGLQHVGDGNAGATNGRPLMLEFCVEDSGIGIPPDKLSRLFKAFSQVDSSTARQYGGTGLGLAIAKRLVEAMGGRMWVHSVAGSGSAFYFTLPTEAAPASTGPMPNRTPIGMAPRFDRELALRLPLRILVAEDNEVNRLVAQQLLECFGYCSDSAANGLEAIAALQRQPYDLVLMDVQMPEMDGLEATRAILRNWPADQRPGIVGLSANALGENVHAALQAGMDDYLIKPIVVQQLRDILVKWGEIKARTQPA